MLALILASMGILDDIPEKKIRLVVAEHPYFVSGGNNCPFSLLFYEVRILNFVPLELDPPFQKFVKIP